MARILVVEDDHDLLFLYRAALSRPGHVVTTAARTGDALALLERDAFDLIILDMNMPDQPGLRVIEYTREHPRLSTIPIVVISANQQYQPAVTALGVTQFLVKPVAMKDLLDLIVALTVP